MLELIRWEHGRPHVLRYVIGFQFPMLSINIGYRVYNVLGYGIPMVRFHGFCDGKIMVRKTICFWILCKSLVFSKKILACAILFEKIKG